MNKIAAIWNLSRVLTSDDQLIEHLITKLFDGSPLEYYKLSVSERLLIVDCLQTIKTLKKVNKIIIE